MQKESRLQNAVQPVRNNMLKSLSVNNFALIEELTVDFGEGLNILTGETGAGKSILIDALGAVLGDRISLSNIRAGCETLRVEAVFLTKKSPAVKKILSELEIEEEDDGTLIITRKVNRNGKSSIVVNGSHLTLASLKKLGATLTDVHGQNENLALLKEESVYNLIDGAEEKISDMLADYSRHYRLWHVQMKALEEKRKNKSDNDQRLDMLRWQEQEISSTNLKPNEDEEIETEIRKLSHAEKIAEHIEESCLLLGGGAEFDVLTALAKVEKNLDDVSRYDDKLNSARKLLEDAAISLREVYDEVRGYSEGLDFSPKKLEQLQARMDVIYRLKQKYGSTVEEILSRLKKIREDIYVAENFETDLETTQQVIKKLEEQTKKKAATLLKMRKNAAATLSSAVEKEIRMLGMEKAQFAITVEPTEEFSSNGADAADMIFSANVGEEAKSLSKVASGGELSRIALAIKTISAGRDNSPETMVFDEIDTGLGGTTAKVVAECIAKVSRNKQVLCITHLAQIACMADFHLHITKTSDEERTVTQVELLKDSDRVREISRMASGEETPSSLRNAREMINSAAKTKRFMRDKIL